MKSSSDLSGNVTLIYRRGWFNGVPANPAFHRGFRPEKPGRPPVDGCSPEAACGREPKRSTGGQKVQDKCVTDVTHWSTVVGCEQVVHESSTGPRSCGYASADEGGIEGPHLSAEASHGSYAELASEANKFSVRGPPIPKGVARRDELPA